MRLHRFCEAVALMNSLRRHSAEAGDGNAFRSSVAIRTELEAELLRILKPGPDCPVFAALAPLLEMPIAELFRPALNRIAADLAAEAAASLYAGMDAAELPPEAGAGMSF